MNILTHHLGGLQADGTDLVDRLLRRGQVHLIGGPNPGDSFTLLMMLGEALHTGGRFFGRQAHRTSCVFLSTRLSRSAVLNAVNALGLNVGELEIVSALDLDRVDSDLTFLDAAKIANGTVVLVDQLIDLLKSDPNKIRPVHQFLAGLQRTCAERSLTIVACHPSGKLRQRDLIFHPRQRLYGSVAWGRDADLVIWVEPKDLSDSECKERIVEFTFPNGQGYRSSFEYDQHGKLVPPGHVSLKMTAFKHDGNPLDDADPLPQFLAQLKKDNFRTRDFLCFATKLKRRRSPRTLDRLLDHGVDDGIIVRTGKGYYRRGLLQ